MNNILPELTAQNDSIAAQEQVDKQHKEYHLIGRQHTLKLCGIDKNIIV
jgi:hypothetical protein